MLQKLNKFLERILQSNFSDCIFKYTYLYNELFISIYDKDEFVLFWILYKANKLKIKKYAWTEYKNWKILLAVIKKYEEVLLKLLEKLNKNLFNIWEESEFINIYDKKELSLSDIKTKLDFNFLDDYSYRRKIQNDFNFEDKKVLDIYHSDFECSKCNWPEESFTSFPDFYEIFDNKYFKNTISINKGDFLVTNVNDYESITIWWNEKINEILSNSKLLENYDMISINKTCISVIMWDDIMSIYKYNNVDPKKIFYTDQNTDSPYRTVINFLSNINIKKWRKTNKIVFFGLNKNKNTYELIQFLSNNFWIDVWNTLLPNINIKDLESILDYKLAIFFKWRETKAQNIFKLYPVNNLESTLPYWITKIYDLCKNILKRYKKIKEINNLKKIINSWKVKNKILFDSSKTFGIGFIINDFHIKHFMEDSFRWVPIISMLNDMWFKLNFFIYNNNEKYSNDLEKFNKKNDLDYINNFNTIISRDKKDLEKFLNDQNIQLYYSEISSDKRILNRNKEQFSIWDLEYGIEWFYRTFKLLIKKCEKVNYYNYLLKNEW